MDLLDGGDSRLIENVSFSVTFSARAQTFSSSPSHAHVNTHLPESREWNSFSLTVEVPPVLCFVLLTEAHVFFMY